MSTVVQRTTIPGIVLLSVIIPLVAIGCGLLWYHRKNVHVSSRSPKLVILSVMAGLLIIATVVISTIISEFHEVSCHAVVWPMVQFLPGFVLPYFFRAYILYFNHKWRSEVAQGKFNANSSWNKNFRRYRTKIIVGIYTAVILVFLFLTGVGIRISQIDPSTFIFPVDPNCSLRFHNILLVVQAISIMILLVITACFLFRVRDAFAFKWELITVLIAGLPVVVFWALSRVIPALNGIPLSVWPIMLYLVCFCMSVVVPLVQIYRTRSQMKRGDSSSVMLMEQLPSVSSNADFLLLVMDSPPLWDSLQKFMVVNWSIENLHFLAAERKFQEMKGTPAEIAAEARRLFDTFIAPMSLFELNLDSVDREAVMENMANKVDQEHLFEVARVKVFGIVKHDSLPRWRTSSEFEEAWAKHLEFRQSHPDVTPAPQ